MNASPLHRVMALSALTLALTMAACTEVERALAEAPNPCTEQASATLAVVYIMSVPVLMSNRGFAINDGTALRDAIAANPGPFREDGQVVACARLTGERLQREGIRLYDPTAYGRVMSTAPVEMAHLSPGVAERINGPATDLLVFGTELVWLSRVLPSLSRGELTLFQTTGTSLRIQTVTAMRFAMPMLQLTCGMDPWSCAQLIEVMGRLRPLIDEIGMGMVYYFARAAGGAGP